MLLGLNLTALVLMGLCAVFGVEWLDGLAKGFVALTMAATVLELTSKATTIKVTRELILGMASVNMASFAMGWIIAGVGLTVLSVLLWMRANHLSDINGYKGKNTSGRTIRIRVDNDDSE